MTIEPLALALLAATAIAMTVLALHYRKDRDLWRDEADALLVSQRIHDYGNGDWYARRLAATAKTRSQRKIARDVAATVSMLPVLPEQGSRSRHPAGSKWRAEQ